MRRDRGKNRKEDGHKKAPARPGGHGPAHPAKGPRGKAFAQKNQGKGRPERSERSERPGRSDRPGHSDRPGRPERPQRPERPEASQSRPSHSPQARPSQAPVSRGRPLADPGQVWLFGFHAVKAALENPRRKVLRLLSVGPLGPELAQLTKGRKMALGTEIVPRNDLDRLLPPGAVHQGLALQVSPLPVTGLEDFLRNLGAKPAVIVALDQLTDPHNVGAIFRSASAFGAAALLSTQDHSPPESGTLAKAASGALEHLPYLREVNLSRALERLKQAGFWTVGLAEEGTTSLAEMQPGTRTVLVLGAEGEGLRRLTREHCDLLARLPTRGPIQALNVSNAAAVALYELLGRQAVGAEPV